LESAFGIDTTAESATVWNSEKQRIRLRTAEKELAEAQKKFEAGVIGTDELEQLRAARDLAAATNELERAQIQVRQSNRDLKRISKLVETGQMSLLDLERAKSAQDLFAVELKQAENGSPKAKGRPEGGQSTQLQHAFRRLFAELGINMETQGKSLFYNPVKGILMVRATTDDLIIVQATIETLGGMPTGQIEQDQQAIGARDAMLRRYGFTPHLQRYGPQAAPDGADATADSDSGRRVRRTVSVLGQVNNPGVIELPANQRWGIVDVIAAAGGFTKIAKKTQIEVTHNGKTSRFRFDEVRTASNPADYPVLEPGDVVFVPDAVL
jgi:hypothetical protein